jgi:hypothetical protein
VAAGLAGLVFCFALYRTGSLWWAIGIHAAWDWSQSFLYGVADSGLMAEGHLFATHPVGKPILSGGLTGPEGSVFWPSRACADRRDYPANAAPRAPFRRSFASSEHKVEVRSLSRFPTNRASELQARGTGVER